MPMLFGQHLIGVNTYPTSTQLRVLLKSQPEFVFLHDGYRVTCSVAAHCLPDLVLETEEGLWDLDLEEALWSVLSAAFLVLHLVWEGGREGERERGREGGIEGGREREREEGSEGEKETERLFMCILLEI